MTPPTYNLFLDYDEHGWPELKPEELLIHRMALVFRESELEIPSGFVREVKQKIHGFWLRPENIRTFQEGVRRAEREGYTREIV